VPLRDLASRQEISANYSVNYLAQLLISLKSVGLIKSIRSARGGYMLVFKPSRISLYETSCAAWKDRWPRWRV
jgi:DNA-binding IscR family transcriptional regulator